jgi:hypothetical protein
VRTAKVSYEIAVDATTTVRVESEVIVGNEQEGELESAYAAGIEANQWFQSFLAGFAAAAELGGES